MRTGHTTISTLDVFPLRRGVLTGELRFRFVSSCFCFAWRSRKKESEAEPLRGRGFARAECAVRKKREKNEKKEEEEEEEEPIRRPSWLCAFQSRREGAITNTPFSVAVNDECATAWKLPLGSLPLLMI